MSSQLHCNQSVKLTQPSSPVSPTVPCTLTDLITPRTHILANVGITPENETILRKSNVPENDGSRREHDEVGEEMVSPSSMNMNPSPSRHIPTTGVTAMMIQ